MRAVWTIVRPFCLLVLLPLAISSLTASVVRQLVEFSIIHDDAAGVMFRVAGVLVDLLLQSAYFTLLIAWTKYYGFVFVLLIYQTIVVTMFLLFGSPTLLAAVWGTIDILWHELIARLGML